MSEKQNERAAAMPCYIGRLPCGCVLAACVDDPKWAKQTARDIASWIREGMAVERVTCATALLSGWPCPGKPDCASKKMRKHHGLDKAPALPLLKADPRP
jgi:hypothetical protein